MKKVTFFALFMMIAFFAIAQSPFYFNYQAAVRNNQNQVLANQNVSLKFSILENSETGSVVFTETHNTQSSALGIVNLQIGKGQNQTGSLSSLNWKNKSYWLKVEIDDAGGTNYKEMGISQLVSVPYALHAETATYVDDADANPQNELQTLSFNTANNELSISNGNSVTIPSGGTDADADPKNEIQTLSKNGNIISLSKNGGSVTDAVDDADADPQNELQNLSLTGNTLSISKGNQVDLSSYKSYWEKTNSWPPNGILHIGPVYMDTVLVDWQVRIGNNNPYGTQIFDSDFFMNDNVSNTNLSLTANTLEFEEDADIDYSKLSKDSLFFRYDPGGLLWPQTAKYASNGLNLESLVNKTRLDAYSLNIFDDKYESYWESNKWGIKYKLSESDIFDRINIAPDELNMFSDSKWKYIQLGKDPDFDGGMLKISDEGGSGERVHLLGLNDGGGMLHFIANNELRAELFGSIDGSYFDLFGHNNSVQLRLFSDDDLGGGHIYINDTLNTPQIDIWVTRDTLPIIFPDQDPVTSMGHIYSSWDIYSPLVQSVIEDTVFAEMDNFGFTTEGGFFINKSRALKSQEWNIWDPSVLIQNGNNEEGSAIFRGKNGKDNVRIFGKAPGQTSNGDFGAIYVYNDQGIAQAGIEVDPNTGQGIVWGNSKQFRIPYPDKPDKEIVYASIEGPETAVYARGTAKLKAGEAFVHLPDYFTSIANVESMTVILTPLDWDTYGLAAIEKSETGFKVKELKGGKGNFTFDWEVKAVRKGFEDFEVVRQKPDYRSPAIKPVKRRNPNYKKPEQSKKCKQINKGNYMKHK